MDLRTRFWFRRLVIASLTLALVGALTPLALVAQATNPRYGKWRLKPTDPTQPSNNVMTYEPHQGTGMKVTINTLGADGTLTPQWGYNTMFDGKDGPMTGSRSAETAAVRMITDRIAEIVYKRNGTITQILTNVLSPDGNTIGIIYVRPGRDGKPDGVTFATYERMKD
jgi:hypothetical protein